MRQIPLKITFHNPNTIEVTEKHLIELYLQSGKQKLRKIAEELLKIT